MAINTLSKLEKLKINAYSSGDRSRSSYIDTFEAMFNPTSFAEKYRTVYDKRQSINTEGKTANYAYSPPTELTLKLILDGTGVSRMGLSGIMSAPSVSEQVEKFLKLTYHMNGDIHQPNFLEVAWGDMKFWGDPMFPCRLRTLDISYTTFDRDGTALRAELNMVLISDQDLKKQIRKEGKNSPDLTHTRLVKSGDTLPLLCKEIYGQSSYYMQVAQVNQINNFRNLTPGQTIFFPPLATQSGS